MRRIASQVKSFVVLSMLSMLGAGLLSSCAWMDPSTRFRGWESGPDSWPQMQSSRAFVVPATANGRNLAIEIVNAFGDVQIVPADGDAVIMTVIPRDGCGPRVLDMLEYEGRHRLYLLDGEGMRNDAAPESPRANKDAQVTRIGTPVPRIDVVAAIPPGTDVAVRCCARLLVCGSGTIRARCGQEARVWSNGTPAGADGVLDVEIPDGTLDVAQCCYTVRAAVNGRCEFRGAVGDKFVRGRGNVVIAGGQGQVDIDVDGDVYAETSFTSGYPRSDAMGGGTSGDDLVPIGPGRPTSSNAGRASEEAGLSVNSIKASQVEVRLPAASALEVRVAVSDGHVEFAPPPIRASGGAGVMPVWHLHEGSDSTLHFSLGAPRNELRVNARCRAEIIVLDK